MHIYIRVKNYITLLCKRILKIIVNLVDLLKNIITIALKQIEIGLCFLTTIGK